MKKIVPIAIVVLIVILFNLDINLGAGKYDTWCADGAGKLIPSVRSVLGENAVFYIRQGMNGSGNFDAYVTGISLEEYNHYVDAVFECGFRLEFTRGNTWFDAKHMNIFRERRVQLSWHKDKKEMAIFISGY